MLNHRLFINSVATIVFGGAVDVPSGDAMGCPGVENPRDLKYEDFCAGRSEGRAIEVERSIKLGLS